MMGQGMKKGRHGALYSREHIPLRWLAVFRTFTSPPIVPAKRSATSAALQVGHLHGRVQACF